MRILKLTTLAIALAGATTVRAADPAPDAKKETSPATPATAGMTPEQLAEFNRVKVKTEAMEDARDASGLKGFKFSGYMDPSYMYNANMQRGSFQFLVPIAKEQYSYSNGYFSTLALDVQKETDSGTKFHVTLYPLRGGGDVMGENSIVHEASVWVPIGNYKLIAGQLPDWSGYEYYAPNLYKNITHNLLFDFTLPASYTGLGLEVPAGKWDFKLMLANMNASIRNVGESIPMFVFRGDYAAAEFYGLGLAGAAGYKPNVVNGGKDTLYTTLEVDGWYTRGDVTLNGHVTYGSQDKASVTADPDTGKLRKSTWIGASVLASYKTSLHTELTLRGDFVYNEKNGGGLLDYGADPVNGVGPGTDPEKGANRYAATATLSYYLNSNVTLKFEGRYDGATQAVFGDKKAIQAYLAASEPDGSLKKNNVVAGTAVVVYF